MRALYSYRNTAAQEEFWDNKKPACQVSSPINRELKQRRRGRQRERQKAIGLISKTTTLHVHHASFVHFFAVVARLQRENA